MLCRCMRYTGKQVETLHYNLSSLLEIWSTPAHLVFLIWHGKSNQTCSHNFICRTKQYSSLATQPGIFLNSVSSSESCTPTPSTSRTNTPDYICCPPRIVLLATNTIQGCWQSIWSQLSVSVTSDMLLNHRIKDVSPKVCSLSTGKQTLSPDWSFWGFFLWSSKMLEKTIFPK